MACLVYIFIKYRLYRSKPFTQFYAQFSNANNLLPLKYAFDLKLHSRNENLRLFRAAISNNIGQISRDEVRQRLKDYLSKTPEKKQLRLSSTLLTALLVLLVALGALNTDAFWRSTYFWKAYRQPNPYQFSVTPGNTTIEQGTTFTPVIHFNGAVPEELSLAIKTDVETNFRNRPLIQSENQQGEFTTEPITLNTDARYFVVMDGFESERYSVQVQLRPRFESLTLNVVPPGYTGLDSTRYQYPFSNIRAYRGSIVTVSGMANKPLLELNLISGARNDTSLLDPAKDRTYRHEINVTAPDTLLFSMQDSSGLTNKNNFEFVIDAAEDEYPFVQVLQPETDIEMPESRQIDIEFETSDDFGLTSASLHYELKRAFIQNPQTGSIALEKPELNTTETYSWDLSELDTKPRDLITFWIEVRDNDGYNGPKRSSSRKITVTYPSLAENLEQLDQKETDVKESLEDVSESFEQMREEYDRFKNQLKENPETTWEQQQTIEGLKDQQKQIDKQVKDLNKKFEEIRNEIKQSDLMSEETLRAYDELKKLMEEIDDPELAKALEELQNALDSMNQQQLKEALENYEFNEEMYRERLERTVELFKTIELNSDLEKMARAFEDLARQEQELSESGEPASDQAEKQEAIREDTERLNDQVDNLSDNPPKKMKNQVQQLQEQTKQEMDSIRQNLEQNIQQLRQQDSPGNNQDRLPTPDSTQMEQPTDSTGTPQMNPGQMSPRQMQQQIQQQFQRLAQNMRNTQQQMGQQQARVNIAALQNILYSLINLSVEQEDLTRETEHLANRSQAFVEKARIEKTISRQFSHIADSLFRVSSEIPQFSNRINEKKQRVQQHLDRAVEQLSERNKSKSTVAQRQSLGGINELSSMIASLLEALQNQMQNGMSGGQMSMQQFMQQLQNMSGQQQQLNQRIQDLINDIQGDRLSRDQIDRLNQLARQQNAIRKQLREMQRNGTLEPGDKLLSELERLAREMEETINDLRGGEANRRMIERQQNILSRMLSAEKALQERDKKDEREGTTAEDTPQTVPPDITIEELQKKIRKMLNNPDRTKFTEDYQKLIEQYFELLRQLQKKEAS